MTKVGFFLDGRRVSAAAGTSILAAARDEGIVMPTLCHHPGFVPSGSCLLCVVRDVGSGRLIPSCASRPVEGQRIETSGPGVIEARRRSVELLLSDHAGDCEAPCTRACPGGVDIPRMIRLIGAGRPQEAAAVMRGQVALPASLSWICSSPCERACRRSRHDAPLAICLLKRFAAERGGEVPQPATASGRHVAVVGSGPAGLSAAWFLLLNGHDCTLYEKEAAPGGTFRCGEHEHPPPEVLETELELLRRLGARIMPHRELGRHMDLDGLCRQHDAVLIATGAASPEGLARLDDLPGITTTARGLEADLRTFETSRPGVFAAGSVLRPHRHPAFAAAQGRDAALSVHRHLAGEGGNESPRPFSSVMGTLRDGEMAEFLKGSSPAPTSTPAGGGYTPDEAVAEARRCLHCDCRKKSDCRLRAAAAATGARQRRYGGKVRTPFTRECAGEVVFEPAKCIRCGLCLQAATRAGGPGLAFLGRGLEMRVGPAYGAALAESLGPVGRECATVCPTGAISLKDSV